MSTTQRANALTQPEIEAIVRVVLQRLRGGDLAANSTSASSKTSSARTAGPMSAAQSIQPSDASATLWLDRSLVTLEDLRDSWSGLRKLQVPSRCVITPAVSDELRQRGVLLERLLATNAAPAANGDAGKLLVLAPRANHGPIARQIASSGAQLLPIEQECSSTCLAAIRQHLAMGEQFCVWCTSRPFAAVRACSDAADVVAVQLPQLEDLSRAIEQAQPNVLVVDAVRWNAIALTQLIRQWSRSFT